MQQGSCEAVGSVVAIGMPLGVRSIRSLAGLASVVFQKNEDRSMSKPHNDRKRFEDMDREELLDTKLDLERQLMVTKASIGTAKQQAAATGVYMDVEEFQKLTKRHITLNLLLGKTDSLLRRKKGAMRQSRSPATLSEDFMRVAKVILEPALYDHILNEVKTPQ